MISLPDEIETAVFASFHEVHTEWVKSTDKFNCDTLT